jgi:magnesium transporter
MSEEIKNTLTEEVARLMEFAENQYDDELQVMLAEHDPATLPQLLTALPSQIREYVWPFIPHDHQAVTLEELDDGVRNNLLASLSTDSAVQAASDMEQSELLDVLESASDELADAILRSLSDNERSALQMRMKYPEDSAGRYMSDEWIAIRADVTLETVARYLKRLDELPIHTDCLMVVDRQGIYQGKLPIGTLLTGRDDTEVSEVMIASEQYVEPTTDAHVFAPMFEQFAAESLAVVDDEHRLVGRITVKDALDVIREQADHQVMHMAGLDEDEDLFAPIMLSARRRMFWLGINLCTAFLAAWVIGLFEATLDKVVALAVLMPIVASMGGIAGSQTLTLAIRGLALGQITSANTRWLAMKEITIAIINGAVWAVVVSFIAWLWFRDIKIAAVLASAMLINQFAAAISGISVPLILEKLGIDPALSGSVILTTVTDVVGFMSFLGLATLVLL